MNEMIEAIKAGNLDQVKALLAQDPNLANAKDADGTSAVLIATYRGRRDMQKALLAAKPSLTVFEAAAVGDEQRVMAWVRAQPELLEAYSHDGFTPLQLGSFFSHADVVKFLLARGANANAVSRNPMKLMALHSSVAANHIPIIKLLLANGAEVNALQEGGFAPLHGAAQNGNIEMIQLLLTWGADPSLKTNDGKTARDYAREGGHAEAAALLLAMEGQR
jgi:ankyrin repeat protein